MLRHIRLFSIIFLTFISLLGSPIVMAQDAGAQGDADALLEDSVDDFITVGALGGVGFVLGLSTLSFVDEPEDHLKNLWVGFAIGIIAGVGVVAWKQANKSQQEIYQQGALQLKDFSTKKRITWHKREGSTLNESAAIIRREPLQFNYQFNF